MKTLMKATKTLLTVTTCVVILAATYALVVGIDPATVPLWKMVLKALLMVLAL